MYHHMITALESCLANGSNASSQHAANKVNSRSILSNSLVSMAARRYGLNHSTSSIQFSSLSAEALSSQNVLQHANQPITNAIDQLDSHPREYLASSSSSLSLTQSEESLTQSEESVTQSEESVTQSEESLTQSEESLTQSEETLSQRNEINLPNSILPESQTVLELPLLDILKTIRASIRQISSTSESTSSADNSVRQLLQLIRTALQTMPSSRPRQEQIREESVENLSVILEETQEQLTN